MKPPFFVILIAIVLLAAACHKSEVEERREGSTHFALSRQMVEIVPGDTAHVLVGGQLEFSLAVADESVVTARRQGRMAIITGIAEGTTTVTFLSPYADIDCMVTVKDDLMHDYTDTLADATPRIVGSGISLVYGEPGIMLIERDGGSQVEFIDIATASRVALQLGADGVERATINGAPHTVASCTLHRTTSTRRWYLVTLMGSIEGFWAVI